MRSPIAAISAALVLLTGCNAGDVMSIAHAQGIDLTPTEAQSVADHYNACDADVACTIRAVWPDASESWALAVAKCESGLNPRARNGSHAGLFQLARRYHEPKAAALGLTWAQVATQAKANTEVALVLYRQQGTTPWNASRSCWS
jgi:hypothetical protein